MHAVERQVKRHKSTVLAAGNHFGPASLPDVCAISSSGGDWENKKSVPLAKEEFSDCSEYGIFLFGFVTAAQKYKPFVLSKYPR